MRNYTNTIKVFDGIIELLKNLLSLDYKMGIVTSKTREEFSHDFCPFGISHYFKSSFNSVNNQLKYTYFFPRLQWKNAQKSCKTFVTGLTASSPAFSTVCHSIQILLPTVISQSHLYGFHTHRLQYSYILLPVLLQIFWLYIHLYVPFH